MEADKRHFWHPFTDMRAWCAPDHDPLILTSGRGPYLYDAEGRRYLDGNASIWTNIHGHGHPRLIEAIERQARRLAHASCLGSTNEPAARLAEKLCALFPAGTLTKTFFSDDGSTAIECALRMAVQYWQHAGHSERTQFLVFDRAYHGDTAGAAALGGIPLFHDRLTGLGFPVIRAASIDGVRQLDRSSLSKIAAVVVEPLIQGAGGMWLWPSGMLRALREWCNAKGIFLILDEVMTGFGRTGKMFACEHEGVIPDFLALAKGLTGGTVPLAATLTTETVFKAFLGAPEERRTFFYGHSYTGNPIGCAAALANLAVFEEENVLAQLPEKAEHLGRLLDEWRQREPHIAAVRRLGLIAGIDIARASGKAFPPSALTGARICTAARKHGLLTRPIFDTLVMMPPLCITCDQLAEAVDALAAATSETLAS